MPWDQSDNVGNETVFEIKDSDIKRKSHFRVFKFYDHKEVYDDVDELNEYDNAEVLLVINKVRLFWISSHRSIIRQQQTRDHKVNIPGYQDNKSKLYQSGIRWLHDSFTLINFNFIHEGHFIGDLQIFVSCFEWVHVCKMSFVLQLL